MCKQTTDDSASVKIGSFAHNHHFPIKSQLCQLDVYKYEIYLAQNKDLFGPTCLHSLIFCTNNTKYKIMEVTIELSYRIIEDFVSISEVLKAALLVRCC